MRRDVGLTIDEILYQDGYVELELGIGKNKIKVKRSQKSPKLQITINGKTPYKGMSIPEQELKLEEIIGYDYEGFISSFFIRQQELQIFSSLSSAERQKRLAKLFKLKVFQNMEKNLKEKIDKSESAYDKLDGAISSDNERIAKIPETKEELKKAQDGLKQISSYISKQKTVVKTAKENLESMVDKVNEYNAITTKIGEWKRTKIDNERNLSSYKQKQGSYEKIKNQLIDFKDLTNELFELRKTRDEIKDKKMKKALLQAKIEKEEGVINQTERHFTTQITKEKNEVTNLQLRLKSLSSDMTKEEAFKILNMVGSLSERLSRLQTIEIPMAEEYSDKKRIQKFENDIQTTEEDIIEFESRQDKITKDVFIADELYTRIKEIEQEVTTLEEQKSREMKKYNNNKKSLLTQMKNENLDENFDQKLKPLEQKLTSLESEQKRKEILEKELANLQDFTALIQKTDSDIVKIIQSLAEYEKSQKELEPFYKEYQSKQTQLNKDENELNDFIATQAGVKVRVDMLKATLGELQDLQKKIQSDKKILAKMKREIDVLIILRKQIFHLDGIPKFALEKILPAISIRASSILGDLTNGRLNKIVFVPLGDNRIGFDIRIDDGESEREASTFSGGEKTQINAAIRFAIMERIDEIPDTTGAIFRKSDTLFIDEGDLGTLDDDSSRQLFVDKIMGDGFSV